MACEARQEGDEMACACGLRWEIKDPNPPACRRQRHAAPVPSSKRELLQGARREANIIFASGAPDCGLGDNTRRFWPVVMPGAETQAVPSVTTTIPTELPTPLAGRMITAYERAVDAGENNQVAMRAAYRVFLDSLP